MSFDGVDDYVDVGSSESLMIIGDLSISFNINLDILQTYYQDIVTYVTWGESLTTNALYAIEIPPNTNTLKYVHEYSSGSNEEVVLNYNLNPDQWYSITIIRDSQNKEIYFYVDNVLIQTSSYLYNPDGGTASSLTMGWSNNSPFVGEKFKGELDNVQIWNNILSQQEIQDYMNCSPTGNEDGLVGYWNFEEGSGTTTFDQTSNANNGTINEAIFSTDTPEQSCSFCSSSDEIGVTINVCGCTDSEAVNYNLDANEDDGSCCYDIDYVNDTYDEGYADGVDSVICPENNCPADLDDNGYVSTSDLLMFLTQFGTICE